MTSWCFTLGIVDERDRRRGDGGKGGGFPRMIDPQLDHCSRWFRRSLSNVSGRPSRC